MVVVVVRAVPVPYATPPTPAAPPAAAAAAPAAAAAAAARRAAVSGRRRRVYPEAIDARDELLGVGARHLVFEGHEEEVWEGGTKERPVQWRRLQRRHVRLAAARAEDLHRVVLRLRVAPELRIVGGWFCFGFDLI
jgi:hypothetical protein